MSGASSLPQQRIGQVSGRDGSQAFVGSFNNCNFSTEDPKVKAVSEETASACRNALFLTDSCVDRETLISTKGTRVAGTCEWITRNERYRAWLDGSTRLLWISGGPGKGKTMMSIFLTEQLEKVASNIEDAQSISHFCSNQDEKRNTGVAVLRGLVHQIVTKRPQLIKYAIPYFETTERTQQTLSSLETLWLIFNKLVTDSELGTMFCVLDGLDECGELGSFLSRMVGLLSPEASTTTTTTFRLVIVSRDMPGLQECMRVRLDPDNNKKVLSDIERFIAVRVDELSRIMALNNELRIAIQNDLLARAQGTFLWVGFAMHELLQKRTPSDVLEALKTLPSGLPAIYGRMLLQIPARQKETSTLILRWVTMATRPLELQELAAAAGIQSSSALITTKQATRDAIATCGPLLKVQEQEVILVHQSARDYLLRKERDSNTILEGFRMEPEKVHLELARICLDCVTQSSFQHEIIDFRKLPIPGYSPLLLYAALHWPEHAKSASALAAKLFDSTIPFFQKASPLRQHWWESYKNARGIYSPLPLPFLHMASCLGIIPWVEAILAKKSWRPRPYKHVNKKDERGWTALHYAAHEGDEALARLLLDRGADVKSKEFGQTALLLAATHNNEALVQLLLDRGADVNFKDNGQKTALIVAAAWGHEVIVQILVDRGADIHAKGDVGRTALSYAAEGGHSATVQMLLDKGAGIHAKDERGRTALHLAVSWDEEATCQILVDSGADIDVKDRRGRTAVDLARLVGHDRIVQMLKDRELRK